MILRRCESVLRMTDFHTTILDRLHTQYTPVVRRPRLSWAHETRIWIHYESQVRCVFDFPAYWPTKLSHMQW